MRETCPGAITNTTPQNLKQELNPDLCVERVASNRSSPDMLLFPAAHESENSHSFLTFGDIQGNTLHYPSLLRTYHPCI